MSRIDDLIAELCPDGVEFKTLGDVAVFKRGSQLRSVDLAPGPYPVVTASRSENVYHSDWNYDEGSVTVTSHGAYVGHVNYWKSRIWLANNVFLLLPATEILDARYFYFFLKRNENYLHGASQGGGIPYINVRDITGLKIPVPPLEVQREIVKILDTFTALEAELEAELEARRRQYEHYRDQLLTSANSGSPQVLLEEVADFFNAKPHERLVDPAGSVALMTSRFISTEGRVARYVRAEDVLTPAFANDVALVMSDLPSGRALAKAFFVNEDKRYAANQRVCLLRTKDATRLTPRFLYYVINRNEQLLAYDSGVDQTHLKKDYILKVQLGLPPIAEQERIVAILDMFDALVNDLSIGLPAELKARRQQYEYYRDKLLTFHERVA